jgi:thioredoxin reductase (NADPH)
MRQIIIIGSGPAGYTAGIYAARAGLEPLIVASSVEAGGELMKTTEVENFPGFPDGIMGPDLMFKLQEQAEKFGAEVLLDDVTSVDLTGDVKKVTLGSGTVEEAVTVIFATGSAYRKLGLADEERLSGRGVSWCATCDGFFFKQKEIAVVGGGDSAMEEATFLTRFASKVYVIHRGDSLRASKIMQERAFANEKIEFLWNKTVTKINGDEKATGVQLTDTVDGSTSDLDLDGLFIAIGNDPRVHLVHNQLDLTSDGTIAVECRDDTGAVRRVDDVAGSGVVAALDAEHFLASLDQHFLAENTDGAAEGIDTAESVAVGV